MRGFMVGVGILAVLMGVTAGNVHGQGNSRAAESFVLSGVISFDGGGGLAWLQEPTLTNNQVVAVRRGDSVGPYRLTEIFEDRVELEGPAGKIFVPLYSAQAGPAAPGPQTAAAPAPTAPAAVANLQQLLKQAAQQTTAVPATPPPAPAGLERLLDQPQQQTPVQAQQQHPQGSAEHATAPQPGTPAMSTGDTSANAHGMLHQPGSPRQQGLGALLEALGRK